MKRGILEWISIGLVIIGMGAGIYSAVDKRIDDLSVRAAAPAPTVVKWTWQQFEHHERHIVREETAQVRHDVRDSSLVVDVLVPLQDSQTQKLISLLRDQEKK